MTRLSMLELSFVRQIQRRMKDLGLGVGEVAERSGMSTGAVARMLNGEGGISFRMANRIAEALGMTFSPAVRPRGKSAHG